MHAETYGKVGSDKQRIYITVDFPLEQLQRLGPTAIKEKLHFMADRYVDNWAKFHNVTDPE